MILFLICLLTAQVFASNENVGHLKRHVAGFPLSSYPMDKDDDIYNRDVMINPNTNIIYHFEQIRRDQPPQIEQREENIGVYMYRRPTSTTPEPNTPPHIPIFSSYNSMLKKANNQFAANSPSDNYNNPLWNQPSFPTMPTSSTPSWKELSDSLNDQHFPHFPSQIWNTDPVANHNDQQKIPPTSLWTQPIIAQEMSNVPSTTTQNVIQSSPTTQEPETTQAVQQNFIRGSHKFSWDDEAATVSQPTVSSSTPLNAPQQRHGPPPPVPTLTPWHGDNFGK